MMASNGSLPQHDERNDPARKLCILSLESLLDDAGETFSVVTIVNEVDFMQHPMPFYFSVISLALNDEFVFISTM